MVEALLTRLDEETRQRRRVLAELQRMSNAEIFQLMVRAGIYNANNIYWVGTDPMSSSNSAIYLSPKP